MRVLQWIKVFRAETAFASPPSLRTDPVHYPVPVLREDSSLSRLWDLRTEGLSRFPFFFNAYPECCLDDISVSASHNPSGLMKVNDSLKVYRG